ncbi:hypothetical protein DFP72DRAFT_85644 [Ephemerocybe angulata]|uniref:Peptidase C14 caspase domain-containing protein n=1 Tax=Ephemerocybe angulata TaxID=980116 RepID=A0A8H6HDM5_9AGAR|nr:hypothetical protein DFP72DRAFT_85644 [Tulosesus angulatus]
MNPAETYALVIGINEYQSPEYSDLTAGVGDANAMASFLETTLKVPAENIINLRDRQASRRGILNGFKALELRSEKSFSTCIIIFYAGHGARTERPLEWQDWATDSEHVEMLCPSDIGMPTGSLDGSVVEGIPDRTVCYLLNGLSQLRGNNITLILDCCCSAGLNRGGEAMEVKPRQIINPPKLSGRADPRVTVPPVDPTATTTTRGMRRSPGFGGKFQDSHVLLAACGRDRVAYEHDGRGLFTSVLLSNLQQVNLQTMTYTGLMGRLKMPHWQTPHCEGSNVDRPLFNRQGRRSDPAYIPCKRYFDGDKKVQVSIDAGMAQGITVGELFAIHENNYLEDGSNINPQIGVLSAKSVATGTAFLQHPPGHPKFKIPKNFYAKRIDWGNDPPKVYSNDKAWLERVLLAPKSATGRRVITVDNEDEASLAIEVERDWSFVHLYRNDPLLNEYLPRKFPFKFRGDVPGDIQTIIGAWQHFNYHLHRRGKNEFPQVRMELHYLEPIDPDDDGMDSFEPENYKVQGGNLLVSEPSEVRVPDSDADRPLGMTLYNDGDVPIYPYLFYFDPNDLTIIPWFTAPFGAGTGNVDPPLEAHSQFHIGYGNGAATPWQFCFEDDRDKDVGFFKLFLSVSPVNFHSLIQEESPFKRIGSTRGASPGPADQQRSEALEKLDKDSWGVKMATVIQLRD